jgi:hypothetical protein
MPQAAEASRNSMKISEMRVDAIKKSHRFTYAEGTTKNVLFG